MSLRARMALAAGVAVALAVIAVAFSAYEGTSTQLQGQLDQSLQSLTGSALSRAGTTAGGQPAGPGPGPTGGGGQRPAGGPPSGGGGGGQGFFSADPDDKDEGLGFDDRNGPGVRRRARDPDARLSRRRHLSCRAGRASGSRSTRARRRSPPSAAAASTRTRPSTAGGSAVLATGIGWRGALLVALPLKDVDQRALEPAAAAGADLGRRDPAGGRARAAGRADRAGADRALHPPDRGDRRPTPSGSSTSASTSTAATSWRGWRRPSTARSTRSTARSRRSATWSPTHRTSCALRSRRSAPISS